MSKEPAMAEPPKRPPVPRQHKSRLLRLMGINFYTLREFAPSRKTSMYFGLALTPVAMYFYDRHCAERILNEHKKKVEHLADVPMPKPEDGQDAVLEWPRKVWIMSTRVPDDFEDDRPNRWFKTYIKPVLYAAGYDYSFLNGTVPGALGRRVRERIRAERVAAMAPQPSVNPGELGYTEFIDRQRHAKAEGLTVVIGRNTLKEYLWGLKEGWLEDFDAVEEQKSEETRMQEFKEVLDKDGVFEVPRDNQADSDVSSREEPTIMPSPASRNNASLLAPKTAYSFFSRQTPPLPPREEPEQPASLIIPAVSTIPPQSPLLLLPFDHPLGYLRYWPMKMARYLFCERYRVQHGCETALAIIQAVHPRNHLGSLEDSESQRGVRRIQPPREYSEVKSKDETVTPEDVLTENKKKLRPEWRGDALPETGSRDLDAGLDDEWRYRKTFNDTPSNVVNARKTFYEELPAKLHTARELESRDRMPTKEEQKYPPPTETELRQERLNKEKKWRNDFQGWLLIRRGSKIPWDSRLESLNVLDLNLAKESLARNGFVGETQSRGELS